MKHIYILSAFCAFFILRIIQGFGQTPAFTVIQNGIPSGDSSYYDLCRISANEFWAIGKNGIITKFGTEGIKEIPVYPNHGVDLLNMVALDNENILVCADKGFLYKFNTTSHQWNVSQIKGYENSCFYSICNVNENIAFISGGRSEIVNSKKVIPFGFILKTEDGGKTWKRIFKSVTNMIWSVKYDPQTKQVFALMYSPVKTKLISSNNFGLSWKTEERKMKGLYHDFKILDGKLILAGSENGKFMKNGVIRTGKNISKYSGTGIFWDIEMSEKNAIASSTGGNILFKNSNEEWKLIQSPVKNNLYEICFIDDHSAFVVGSGKTIIKVDFK